MPDSGDVGDMDDVGFIEARAMASIPRKEGVARPNRQPAKVAEADANAKAEERNISRRPYWPIIDRSGPPYPRGAIVEPASIVIRRPAPGLIRDPGPAIVGLPDPAAIAIGHPVSA